jgi:hypothetical protein
VGTDWKVEVCEMNGGWMVSSLQLVDGDDESTKVEVYSIQIM